MAGRFPRERWAVVPHPRKPGRRVAVELPASVRGQPGPAIAQFVSDALHYKYGASDPVLEAPDSHTLSDMVASDTEILPSDRERWTPVPSNVIATHARQARSRSPRPPTRPVPPAPSAPVSPLLSQPQTLARTVLQVDSSDAELDQTPEPATAEAVSLP